MRSDCWHWYQVPSCCWAVHLVARSEDRVGSSQWGSCHCALGAGWRQIWADTEDNIGINRILWCRYHTGITVEHDDIWGGQVESFWGHSVPQWAGGAFPEFFRGLGLIQVTQLCELLVDKLWEAGTPYFWFPQLAQGASLSFSFCFYGVIIKYSESNDFGLKYSRIENRLRANLSSVGSKDKIVNVWNCGTL